MGQQQNIYYNTYLMKRDPGLFMKPVETPRPDIGIQFSTAKKKKKKKSSNIFSFSQEDKKRKADVYKTIQDVVNKYKSPQSAKLPAVPSEVLYPYKSKLTKGKVAEGVALGLLDVESDGKIYRKYVENGKRERETIPIAEINQKGQINTYIYAPGILNPDITPEEFTKRARAKTPENLNQQGFLSGLGNTLVNEAPISGAIQQFKNIFFPREGISYQNTPESMRASENPSYQAGQMVGQTGEFLGKVFLPGALGLPQTPAAIGGIMGAISGLGNFSQASTGEQTYPAAVARTAIDAAIGGYGGAKVAGNVAEKTLGKGILKNMAGQAIGQVPVTAAITAGHQAISNAETGQPLTQGLGRNLLKEEAFQTGLALMFGLFHGRTRKPTAETRAKATEEYNKTVEDIQNNKPTEEIINRMKEEGTIKDTPEEILNAKKVINYTKNQMSAAEAQASPEVAAADATAVNQPIVEAPPKVAPAEAVPPENTQIELPPPPQAGEEIPIPRKTNRTISDAEKLDVVQDGYTKNGYDAIVKKFRKDNPSLTPEEIDNLIQDAHQALTKSNAEIPFKQQIKDIGTIIDPTSRKLPVEWVDPTKRGTAQDEYVKSKVENKTEDPFKATLAVADRSAMYKYYKYKLEKGLGDPDKADQVIAKILDIKNPNKVPQEFISKTKNMTTQEITDLFKQYNIKSFKEIPGTQKRYEYKPYLDDRDNLRNSIIHKGFSPFEAEVMIETDNMEAIYPEALKIRNAAQKGEWAPAPYLPNSEVVHVMTHFGGTPQIVRGVREGMSTGQIIDGLIKDGWIHPKPTDVDGVTKLIDKVKYDENKYILKKKIDEARTINDANQIQQATRPDLDPNGKNPVVADQAGKDINPDKISLDDIEDINLQKEANQFYKEEAIPPPPPEGLAETPKEPPMTAGFNPIHFYKTIGKKLMGISDTDPSVKDNVSMSQNIANSQHINELRARGATPERISQEIEIIKQESMAQDKALGDKATPFDMGSKEQIAIKEAELRGTTEGETRNRAVQNARKIFLSGLNRDQANILVKTNMRLYEAISDVRNNPRLKPEQKTEMIDKIKSDPNIVNTMVDVSNKTLTKQEAASLYFAKWEPMRVMYDKASELEILARTSKALGISTDKLPETYTRAVETIKSYKEDIQTIKDYQALRKDLLKQGLKGTKRYIGIVKELQKLYGKYYRTDINHLKNIVTWVNNMANFIQRSKDDLYLPRWNTGGQYAVSIDHIVPDPKVRNGKASQYSKMPYYDSKMKVFAKFKSDRARTQWITEFLKDRNATTKTGEPITETSNIPDGEIFMDAMDTQGRTIVDEQGNPIRVQVKINPDINLSDHLPAMTRDEMNIKLKKIVGEAGIGLTENKLGRITQINAEKLQKTAQEFRDIAETLEKADPNGSNPDIQSMLATTKDALQLADLVTRINGGVLSDAGRLQAKIQADQIMRRMFSYSLVPRAPRYMQNKNYYGYQIGTDTPKSFFNYAEDAINTQTGRAVVNLEKGYGKEAIHNQIDYNARKGMYNKTYQKLLDYEAAYDKVMPVGAMTKIFAPIINLVAQLYSIGALSYNVSSQIFNHLIGVLSATSWALTDGKNPLLYLEAYRKSLRSSFGKIVAKATEDKRLQYTNTVDELANQYNGKVNPYKKTSDLTDPVSIKHDAYRKLEESGTFGSSLAKTLTGDALDVLSKKKTIDKLYLLQRATEYENRAFSSIISIENYMNLNPFETSGMTRDAYINDMVNKAQMFTARTQGLFGLNWRSAVERGIAEHPIARQVLTLQSPAIRMLYMYRGMFQKAMQLDEAGKKKIAPLLTMILGSVILGGVRAVPIAGDALHVANALMTASNNNSLDKTVFKENLPETFKHQVRGMAKQYGATDKEAEKFADDLYASANYGVMAWLTGVNLQYEGGIAGLIVPFVYSETEKLATTIGKTRKPYTSWAYKMAKVLMGAAGSRLITAAYSLAAGQYLDSQGLPLANRKFDLGDFLRTITLRAPYMDTEAVRSYYEDNVPLANSVQRQDFMNKILNMNGVGYQNVKHRKNINNALYMKLEDEGKVTAFRDALVDKYKDPEEQRAMNTSKEMMDDFIENGRITIKGKSKTVNEWVKYLNKRTTEVYGMDPKEIRKTAKLYTDIADYRASTIVADVLDETLGEVASKYPKPINTWSSQVDLLSKKQVGQYPYDEQAFIYARNKFIQSIIKFIGGK